jgi:hypothetical protein
MIGVEYPTIMHCVPWSAILCVPRTLVLMLLASPHVRKWSANFGFSPAHRTYRVALLPPTITPVRPSNKAAILKTCLQILYRASRGTFARAIIARPPFDNIVTTTLQEFIFARIVHPQVPYFSSIVLPTLLEQFTGWLSHPILGHEEV